MKEFFKEKLEIDKELNLKLASYIEKNEDKVNEFILNQMSHILNMHHIWNCNLQNIESESFSWDKLPLQYYNKLILDNFLTTDNFIEEHELEQKIHFHDSEGVQFEKKVIDILYHILQHSNHHRAQINMAFKQQNITPLQILLQIS